MRFEYTVIDLQTGEASRVLVDDPDAHPYTPRSVVVQEMLAREDPPKEAFLMMFGGPRSTDPRPVSVLFHEADDE